MPSLTFPNTRWFHRLFATWDRLEPRARAADFAQGLEARCADPLWMSGRQWQLGEYFARNGGSLVEARLSYQTSDIQQLEIKGVSEALTLPPEVRIERERVPLKRHIDATTTIKWNWRLRIRVGQQFERLAYERYGAEGAGLVSWARENFRVEQRTGTEAPEVDDATQRTLALVALRVVDGGSLLDLWRSGDDPPDLSGVPAIGGVDAELVLGELLGELSVWYEALYSQVATDTADAWQPDRLDYEFAARAAEIAVAPSGTSAAAWAKPTLTAPSYRNGDLDWFACDVSNLARVSWPPASGPVSYVPTRVTFAGMPHPRWWAFEDSRVDFGDMDVATTDIVRLAFMEFALVYGGDWFLLPLELKASSLTRIALEVRDVFGRTDVINHARDSTPGSRWEMFGLARTNGGEGGGADLLYLPPVLGFREESAAVEECRFLRDEGANKVWAVEHIITNGLGEPVDGFDAQRERAARMQQNGSPTNGSTPAAAALKYRLATHVPANWMPFVPVDAQGSAGLTTSGRSIHLRRAQMLTNTQRNTPQPIPAMTRLLDPQDGGRVNWIREEAVGRVGVTVQVTRQRARSANGETYVWLGRKVVAGKGEGSSGLRFDVVEQR